MSQRQSIDIQIPKIYRVIKKDRIVYIVIEYVKGKTFKELLGKGTLKDYL